MIFLIFTASTILSAHPKYYIGDELNEISVNCDTGSPDDGNSIAEQDNQSEQSKIFDSDDEEGKSKSSFVDNVCHNQHKKFKHDEKDDKALDTPSSGNSDLSQNTRFNGTADFDNTKKLDSFVIVDPNIIENEAYPQSAYAYDAGDINKKISEKLSQSKDANRMSNYESELTAGSTMPNFIANEKSIVSFIQHISMLLQTIERESQKKKQAFLEPLGSNINISEAIVDSAHFKNSDNDEKGVNPDSTWSIKNEEETKQPSKLVNPMYIHNESIINCQLDSVVQLYIPTHIQENCTIEDPIVTLQIPQDNGDRLTNDLKTYIWANNYFTSKTGMHHIANNVLIGRNNKFDSFYIGPFVTIGNGNQFKSVIIFANTTIQDCVSIGKNVIIGKNVTIKCGAVVEDNVIIEDNVTIGSGAIISKNVTIRRDSVVKDRVKICSDVIIGRFVTIYDRTEICTDVVIGDGSLIGKFCKIRDKVIVEPNTYIDGYNEIYNNVIVGGKMGSLNTIHYYVWIQADIGNLCKICNHVRLDNCEIQEAVCIKNNVIVKRGVKIMEDCRISNYVTLKEDTIINRSTKIYDKVVIERRCNIGELNQIFNHTMIGVYFTSGNKCIIKDALIGDGVKIGSLNYIEGIVLKDVIIGDHNLIGSNCIIKEDCNIGDGNGLGCERPNMLCDQTTIPKLLTDCIVEPNCTIGDYNMLCSVRLAKNVHIHSDCVLLNGVHVKKGTFGNHSRVIPKLLHPQRHLMNLLLSDNNINHDFRSFVIEDIFNDQYYIVNADDEGRKIISYTI